MTPFIIAGLVFVLLIVYIEFMIFRPLKKQLDEWISTEMKKLEEEYRNEEHKQE